MDLDLFIYLFIQIRQIYVAGLYEWVQLYVDTKKMQI